MVYSTNKSTSNESLINALNPHAARHDFYFLSTLNSHKRRQTMPLAVTMGIQTKYEPDGWLEIGHRLRRVAPTVSSSLRYFEGFHRLTDALCSIAKGVQPSWDDIGYHFTLLPPAQLFIFPYNTFTITEINDRRRWSKIHWLHFYRLRVSILNWSSNASSHQSEWQRRRPQAHNAVP